MARKSRSKSRTKLKVIEDVRALSDEVLAGRRLAKQASSVARIPADAAGSAFQAHEQASGRALVNLLGPKDWAEMMLSTQMVAAHNMAMECAARAMNTESIAVQQQMLKNSTRAMSVYARLVEVLDKHRGKGQQKVTVEHVNVAPGGKAFVGNLDVGADKIKANKSSENEKLQISHQSAVPFEIQAKADASVELIKKTAGQNDA